MTKKLIIIGAIILIGLIAGLLLLKSGGQFELSSSPGAVVKSFYSAINKGDIDKAKNYVSLEVNLEDLGLGGEHELKFLAGVIKTIEVEDEQTEKAFGAEQAVLTIKIVPEPNAKEEAERRLEEEKNKPLINWDKSVIMKNRTISEFPESQKVFLEKYKEGWKIFDIK